MMFPRTRRQGRDGFTLIELLVVIAIIAVLVALSAAAVLRFLVKGPEVQTRTELSEIAGSLGKFRAETGVYPPSKIILKENGAYDVSKNAAGQPNNPLDYYSAEFLQKLFPRAKVVGGQNDWDGSGGAINANPVTLEGHQCLVYFLAGVNGQGLKFAGTTLGPFFTFQSPRLAGTGTFKHYLDPHGSAYVYFSAYNSMNGYNRYGTTTGDCNAVAPGLFPYTISAGKYHNPEGFQLISAGADKQFGTGGQWTSAAAGTVSAATKDNMANFHQSLLGVP